MKVTRVIAVSVLIASLGLTTLNAQTLRNAAPPAEFPPASYQGKQYVDSNGCIYIRAGIDGNVTWVPRVSRQRKQICGYKPSLTAGTTAKPAPTQAPTVITLDPSQQPPKTVQTTQAAPKPQKTQKTQTVAAPKPTQAQTATAVAQPAAQTASQTASQTTSQPVVKSASKTRTPSPAPDTQVYKQPEPTVKTTRTTTARPAATRQPTSTVATTAPTQVPAPVVAPRQASAAAVGGCSNASEFSQQFINKKGVRCGPQTEAPITYGQGLRKGTSVVAVGPNDRVVPRHVYDSRQNTRNVEVPSGYRSVWSDDRLNPYRAERTIAPAAVTNKSYVPTGFRPVEREDDRLNPLRVARSVEGEAQTDAIWTRTVPRTLIPVPTDRPTIVVTGETAVSSAEAVAPLHLRLSTRSAPAAGSPANVSARASTRASNNATWDSNR